jgi:hypothetical protein
MQIKLFLYFIFILSINKLLDNDDKETLSFIFNYFKHSFLGSCFIFSQIIPLIGPTITCNLIEQLSLKNPDKIDNLKCFVRGNLTGLFFGISSISFLYLFCKNIHLDNIKEDDKYDLFSIMLRVFFSITSIIFTLPITIPLSDYASYEITNTIFK